jgi:hypothetical protein
VISQIKIEIITPSITGVCLTGHMVLVIILKAIVSNLVCSPIESRAGQVYSQIIDRHNYQRIYTLYQRLTVLQNVFQGSVLSYR